MWKTCGNRCPVCGKMACECPDLADESGELEAIQEEQFLRRLEAAYDAAGVNRG